MNIIRVMYLRNTAFFLGIIRDIFVKLECANLPWLVQIIDGDIMHQNSQRDLGGGLNGPGGRTNALAAYPKLPILKISYRMTKSE